MARICRMHASLKYIVSVCLGFPKETVFFQLLLQNEQSSEQEQLNIDVSQCRCSQTTFNSMQKTPGNSLSRKHLNNICTQMTLHVQCILMMALPLCSFIQYIRNPLTECHTANNVEFAQLFVTKKKYKNHAPLLQSLQYHKAKPLPHC